MIPDPNSIKMDFIPYTSPKKQGAISYPYNIFQPEAGIRYNKGTLCSICLFFYISRSIPS
jgi:hypothetical protein